MKQFICDLCLFDDEGPNIMNFKVFSTDLQPDQAFFRAQALHPNQNFVIRAKESNFPHPLFLYLYKNMKIVHQCILTAEELDFMFSLMGQS